MSKQNSFESVDSCFEYSEDGESAFVTVDDGREECGTPKHEGHKIPNLLCPSPPRKKRPLLKSRDPPPTGYFNPPDLEILFSKMNRRAYV